MVKFDFDDRFVRVSTHYDQRNRCMIIPGGRWVPRNKSWEYLLTPTTAMTIRQVFDKDLNDQDKQRLQEVADHIMMAQAVKKELVELQVPATNFPPWHHQLIAYNMVVNLFGLNEQ